MQRVGRWSLKMRNEDDEFERLGIAEHLCRADVTDFQGLSELIESTSKTLTRARFARLILYDAERDELQYQTMLAAAQPVRPGPRRGSVDVRTLQSAVRTAKTQRAGGATMDSGGYDASVDGVPYGSLDEYHVVAVPVRASLGAVVAVIVVGLPQPEGSLAPALRASRAVSLERFAELSAAPVASGLRFLKLRGTLEVVLRPQQEGIKSMAADVGDYDKATRDYLLNSFTANGTAREEGGKGSLDGMSCASESRGGGFSGGGDDVWAGIARGTGTGAGSTADGGGPGAAMGLQRTPSMGSAKGPRRRATADEDVMALRVLDTRLAEAQPLLERWDLDPFAHSEEELQEFLSLLFHSLGLLRRFRISPALLENFLEEVKVRYNANPFHNFRHAFRVSHVAFLFVARSDLRGRALRDLDVLALLFSAICHDLEHPGLTNAYQVNTKHRLALVYNDQSVLENHHCATAFRVVERPECDILRGLPKGDYKLFRKLVVAAILATDMTAHKGIVAVVSARVEADQTGSGGFDRDSLEDRQLLVSFLLHAADLNNPLSPPSVSLRVASLVSAEFNRQAELERAADLQVSVMTAHDSVTKAKMEAGFIDFVVRPLYELLAAVAPTLGNTLQLISETRAMWEEMAKGGPAPVEAEAEAEAGAAMEAVGAVRGAGRSRRGASDFPTLDEALPLPP